MSHFHLDSTKFFQEDGRCLPGTIPEGSGEVLEPFQRVLVFSRCHLLETFLQYPKLSQNFFDISKPKRAFLNALYLPLCSLLYFHVFLSLSCSLDGVISTVSLDIKKAI